MDIKDKIRQFIMEELKASFGDVEYLKDDTHLIENGFLDSLMILNLLAFLEENFGIILSSDETNPENFKTIQAIYDLIVRKMPLGEE